MGPPSQPGLPIVRVSMTDRDVVDRVGRLLDRAVVPLRAREAHHKPPFAVTIKGAPAVDLMTAVRDFMGVKRQSEIQRAIRSWHPRRSRRRRSLHRSGGGPSIAPVHLPTILSSHLCDETCDLAWLAGLLEGEGTFSSTRTQGHNYPVLKVTMCTEDVVSKAAGLLTAPSVMRKEPEREGWSASYVAVLSGSDAAEWMRRLRVFMGHRRTEAIDAALSQYHPIRLVDPPSTCVVPGCGELHRGRGLCHKHYMMWSRDRAKGREARIAPLR
jgi:hypothetical protein